MTGTIGALSRLLGAKPGPYAAPAVHVAWLFEKSLVLRQIVRDSTDPDDAEDAYRQAITAELAAERIARRAGGIR